MKRLSRLGSLYIIGFTQVMILCLCPAYCQPVGDQFLTSQDRPKQSEKTKDEPKVEFYNWLYGSSRRNWFEWHTVTASMNSSLDDTGFRLRGMGAIGGYADNIKGDVSENIIASANETDDYVLPSLGTVGKLYGMNGFGGLQIGYSYVAETWKISAFIGAAYIRVWSLGSNMTTQIIKFSADPSTLNGMRYGILASVEGEYHPTNQLMFSVWGIYSPAYSWGYFEMKSGVALPFKDSLPTAILDNAYIGPHMALSISEGIRQPMLGAHLSGVKIGPVFISLNGGYTHEQFSGNGVYSILETSIEF